LVFLSEQGVRVAELTTSLKETTLDTTPAWSPDGRAIVFARAQGATLDQPRLHVVSARAGSEPRAVTQGSGRERDPRWFADGKAILYASDEAGSFDLYRLPLSQGEDGLPRAAGPPQRLTAGKGQEVSPTIAPDGKSIIYMEIAADGGDSRLRKLSLVGPKPGEDHAITAGPLDVTPAFNPEKPGQIAFASRAGARNDMDMFLLDVETGEQTPLPAVPVADLTGPVWSIDGRHLFATAVFRSITTGDAILSSVVVLDTFVASPVWRALHDPAFTESRIGVAVAPRALLPSAIEGNQPYTEALKAAIEQHLIQRK